MVTIKDVLNKLKWTDQLSNHVLVYVSRGSPNNEETIDLSRIITIGRDGFTFINNDGRETYIPYHRVVEIRNKDGTVIFHRNVPH
jgi:uncharacterized protein (UPF0248 family)